MLKRLLLMAIVLVCAAAPLGAAGLGPDYLVYLNLERRGDFERVESLSLKPVFRWGNEFYVVTGASTVESLRQLNISYRVVETAPFVSGNYYIESPTAAARLGTVSKLGAQHLDDIAGGRLYKTSTPLAAAAEAGGEGTLEITGEAIPFTYMEQLTVASPAAFDHPDLDSIVARISEDSVEAYDTHLMNFGTRYVYTTENDQAQAYIAAKFLSFGYTNVQSDNFDVYGWTGHNVICTKTGTTDPDKYIVIGAHYDSYNSNSDPYVFAPGADDNGSGTVAVLEIARAMANIPTRKTIVFIAFDAEEVGLVGSEYYAGMAQLTGQDIELMLNMDMIAYNPNSAPDVLIATNPASVAYANMAAQLTTQYTSLWPSISTSAGGSSDHAPFAANGFNFIYAEEYIFNTPGWHTDIDIISRLDMAYLADVTRLMGLSAYVASEAPSPVPSVTLWDAGDGSTLEVQWQPLTDPSIAGYHLYYGTSPGNLTNMINIPGGSSSSRQITGLTPGTEYYVGVAAVNSEGWESLAMTEQSLQPLVEPRMPADFTGNPEYQRIELRWTPAVELDINHYEIYRGPDTAGLALYDATVISTPYADLAVSPATRYFYQIRAIDNTAIPSAMTGIVNAIPATFDQGILVVDLTSQQGSLMPTQEEQEAVYNTMFTSYPHDLVRYETYDVPFDKSELGQYGTIFWVDDDLTWENWSAEFMARLDWYVQFPNNLVFIGWYTPNEVESAGLLYEMFRVSDVQMQLATDCIGGTGEAGFPDVIYDTTKVNDIIASWDGKLPRIWTMTTSDPSSEIIYRYNSATDNPSLEGLPVAVRRSYGSCRTVMCGLPLYWMRDADAQAMIATLNGWFDLPGAGPGDLNADGEVDLLDLMVEIGVVFSGTFPPTGYQNADVNASCICDVLDIVYMIDYVYRGGPAPVEGCLR